MPKSVSSDQIQTFYRISESILPLLYRGPRKNRLMLTSTKGLHLITSLTPNGRKVHILLEELKGAYSFEWTTSLIDLDKNEQKKDWFLRLNPNGSSFPFS
jgi:hypothetical protein